MNIEQEFAFRCPENVEKHHQLFCAMSETPLKLISRPLFGILKLKKGISSGLPFEKNPSGMWISGAQAEDKFFFLVQEPQNDKVYKVERDKVRKISTEDIYQLNGHKLTVLKKTFGLVAFKNNQWPLHHRDSFPDSRDFLLPDTADLKGYLENAIARYAFYNYVFLAGKVQLKPVMLQDGLYFEQAATANAFSEGKRLRIIADLASQRIFCATYDKVIDLDSKRGRKALQQLQKA